MPDSQSWCIGSTEVSSNSHELSEDLFEKSGRRPGCLRFCRFRRLSFDIRTGGGVSAPRAGNSQLLGGKPRSPLPVLLKRCQSGASVCRGAVDCDCWLQLQKLVEALQRTARFRYTAYVCQLAHSKPKLHSHLSSDRSDFFELANHRQPCCACLHTTRLSYLTVLF